MPTVLVVDNDEIILRLFKDIIKSIGHESITLKDAEFALETLLNDLEIDLLITDVVMPGMDGNQLVREVLKHPDTMRFPIIMISGEDIEDEIRDLTSHERVTFIRKPIRVGALIATIADKISATVNR